MHILINMLQKQPPKGTGRNKCSPNSSTEISVKAFSFSKIVAGPQVY